MPFPYLELTENRYFIHWFVDFLPCGFNAIVDKIKDQVVPFIYLDSTENRYFTDLGDRSGMASSWGVLGDI